MTATSQNELTVWSENEKVVADHPDGDSTSPLFNPKLDWRHRLSLRGSHRRQRAGEVSGNSYTYVPELLRQEWIINI